MAQSLITDTAQVPGSGLFSFGSFCFHASSPAGSTLLVPQILFGKRGEENWVTLIQNLDSPTVLDISNDSDSSFLTSEVKVENIAQHFSPTSPLHTLAIQASSLINQATLIADEQNNVKITSHTSSQLPILLPQTLPAIKQETHFPSADTWTQRVSKLVSLLKEGNAQKVVLARQINLDTTQPFHPSTLGYMLHARYPQTWVFGVDNLVGATPELLASTHNNLPLTHINPQEIWARVLAGTLPKTSHSDITALSTQLQNSAKDMAEHHLALQSVQEVLAEQQVQTGQTYILELPNVIHLATDIKATLNNGLNVLDAAGLLHPTAALGGTPRMNALDLIAQIEPIDRKRYGAPVGWLASGDVGQWAIALRCAQINSSTNLDAWAGCGIMQNSYPQNELQETQAKFQPILQAFTPSLP